VSKGHSLIVTKRLVQNYFDLTLKEQTACWIVANKVKTILQENINLMVLTLGININVCGTNYSTLSHILFQDIKAMLKTERWNS
jgi:diadenosine tetraphosphate (Ap4A) HIT family hydrolase